MNADCKQCGIPIPDSFKFCKHCGAIAIPVPDPIAATPEPVTMKGKIHPAWFIALGLLATVVVLTAISDNTSLTPTPATPAKAPAPIATLTPSLIRGKTGTWLTADAVHAASIGQLAAKIAEDNHLTLACDSEIAVQVPASDQQQNISDLDYLGREVRNLRGKVAIQNGTLIITAGAPVIPVAIGAEETTAPRQFEKWIAHLQGIYQDCAGLEKHARRSTLLTSRDLREVMTTCREATASLMAEMDAIPALLTDHRDTMRTIAGVFATVTNDYSLAYDNFLDIKDGHGAGRAADNAIDDLRDGDEMKREIPVSIQDARKQLKQAK